MRRSKTTVRSPRPCCATRPPGDWLNWRRTDNAWGYSPLDQINRQNVGQLQLAWSWAMDDTGAQEATPLVHDGIMYLPNPRGVIQALDAATGDLIWEYRPGSRAAPAPQRGAARGGGGEQTDIPRLTQRPAPPRPPAAATRNEASSETSRSSATGSSAPPTTPTSSRSTREPASSCGTRRSRIRSWDTATRPARSSSAAR